MTPVCLTVNLHITLPQCNHVLLTPSHPHTLTAAPPLPEGKELSSSSAKRSAGIFSHLPSPDLSSIQTSTEEVEERNKEVDNAPLTFQVPSTDESNKDEGAGPSSPGIKINVVDEDEEEEINEDTGVLIRRTDGEGCGRWVWYFSIVCSPQIIIET